MNTTLRNSILHGDCRDASLLPDSSVDLIITSPPYNVGKPYSDAPDSDNMTYDKYVKFTREWMKRCRRWGKENARLCVNTWLDHPGAERHLLFSDIARSASLEGWSFRSIILWKKITGRRTCWGSWRSASAPNIVQPIESILVFHKGDWKREKNGRESDIEGEEFKEWSQGLWEFRGEVGKQIGHPAPFPVELPKRLIKLFSFTSDVVLDPFMGSGTTALACQALGRDFVGIEKEKKFVNLAYNRLGLSYGL